MPTNNRCVKKVIIPAAGYGTRFLPITRTVCKEMLPIIDKPIIDYLIDEAVESGIEEVIIVVAKEKQILIDYYSENKKLVEHLKQKNDLEKLPMVLPRTDIKITFCHQKEAWGLGDAIMCAKHHIKDEYFGVILGDEVFKYDKTHTPPLKRLIECFNSDENICGIVGVTKVSDDDLSKYGIVASSDNKYDSEFFSIKEIIEKPNKEDAPSNYAAVGRYVFSSDIFQYLSQVLPGKNNEIQLTTAIDNMLNNRRKIAAYKLNEMRFDTGSLHGYLLANIAFASSDKSLKKEIIDFIKG